MPATQSLKAHFSNIRKVVCAHIGQTKQHLFVAVAWFTDDQIFCDLLDAAQKGHATFEILIMDDEINRNSGLDYAALEKAGIPVYCSPEELDLMHHKFCVVDDEILLIGSFNWTRKASRSNKESLLVTPITPNVASDFRAEFEYLKKHCVRKYAPAQSVPPPEPAPEPAPSYGSALPGGSLLAASLRARIYGLEVEVNEWEAEKATTIALIEEFDRLLRVALGELLLVYKELETKLAEIRAKLTGKHNDQQAFEAKEQEFKQFSEQLMEDKKHCPPTLSEGDADDIKRLYREAVMLGHPDKYQGDAEKEAQATALMSRLTQAYRDKDLATVRQIHEDLSKGVAFLSDWSSVNDIEQLEALLAKLTKQRDALAAEVEALKASTTWQNLQANPDTAAYSEQVRSQLEQQIHSLKKEIQDYQ